MMKVLVVDDTESVREMLEELLCFHGYHIRFMASDRKALALLEYYALDTVVTDYRMPEMTGKELIRYIREKKPQMRFIVMTGDDLSVAQWRELIAISAYTILRKPFSEEELARMFDEVARISSAPAPS